MAETSGFFQAMVDENTNDYDRKYFAKQFADYFSLFVGNGVFANPTNQLMVVPGTGLSVVVKPGYAFINGYWYWNSTDKAIPLVPNYGTGNRTDTVRVRMSDVTRNMTVDVYTGDTELVRGEDVYDLQLASITVQPMAETLLASAVQDTRPNEQVCGFVTGLLRVETTADLFAQFQSAFDQWFNGIKAELEGVDVGQLLTRMDELETSVDTDIAGIQNSMETLMGNVTFVRMYDNDGALTYDEKGCAYVRIDKHKLKDFSFFIIGTVDQATSRRNLVKHSVLPVQKMVNSFVIPVVTFGYYTGKFYQRLIDVDSESVIGTDGKLVERIKITLYPCREITIGTPFTWEEQFDSTVGSSAINQSMIRLVYVAGVKLPVKFN